MFIAYSIVIKNNELSEGGYNTLITSSKNVGNTFNIQKFEAVTPEYVSKTMVDNYIKWNYPWDEVVNDIQSGLTKTPYTTVNKEARIACALSHYLLWKTCVKMNRPLLILEHDARFIAPIDFDPERVRPEIIGINDPRGATRKSQLYHDKIQKQRAPLQLAPWVDDDIKIPQGLAGNSAYFIKPTGASMLIGLVTDYGLWPNDALICKQLIRTLSVTRKYYTNVQGLKSTTST